ncbi:nickel pincer cofactor biosynthesis protein LarC [Desulfonema magnum]|uniref:Putative nickel insertion protein n=1 Tax=Desulfonema magnum TaxID=45655 RepID=A0A975GT40_9BACT|nr:nickel pincer cofactor biosynthesis protein LarC [Desulfonema magnum]QTA92715.1 Pyridinium-3,5-bisthiocarboxylic acid mononucleotide nickel insertion protein [Desulfonema magnum]
MKIAYFDCFSGASGDMILGSLMDAGLELEQLNKEIAKLHLTCYDLQVKKVLKKGIGGSQALVYVDEEHHRQHHRHLRDIEEIIKKSTLNESVKQKSAEIFRRLAEAEAKVHQTTIEKVHFHEVGAMDAMIDVVGAVAGLAALKIDKIFCSPFRVGTGTVTCAHGTLPVPAPATLELIRGKPVSSCEIKGELLTPTGAAILTTLSSGFGPMPSMTVKAIGYGAGTSELAIPNLLRVVIGDALDEVADYETEQVAVIETSIDDMNPEMYDYLLQKTLDMGVMDIFLSPLQMKKNRPGTLVTVICRPEAVMKISDFLIRETTTIGLRWRVDNRIKAHRTIKKIHTKYGPIKFKVAECSGEIVNISPEYEDCKRVALEKSIPLKAVMEAAQSVAFIHSS